ncbi:MAG: hypothetical protein KC468_11140, partial [Myxococcales bacterium]|nr:hypothetical protein [Myxococcales bacterium]
MLRNSRPTRREILTSSADTVEKIIEHAQDFGLLTGKCGALLCLYMIDEAVGVEDFDTKFSSYIDDLLSEYPSWSSDPAYCTGLPGIAAFFQYLLAEDEELCHSFNFSTDELLSEYLKSEQASIPCEFLYGLAGISNYAINRPDCASSHRLRELCFESLIARSNSDSATGQVYWHESLRMNKGEREAINLGFAHGMPAIMRSIALLGSQLGREEEASKVLNGAFSLMSECLNLSDNSKSALPNRVGGSFQTRLAWCYGDYSAMHALNFTSLDLGIEQHKLISSTLKERVLSQLPRSQPPAVDLSICHGVSGQLLMTTLMEDDTQNGTIRAAIDFYEQ